MGAFQSHDAHDHPTSDAFDLRLDVTVAEGALPPRYETPSASQFALYANETVAVEGRDWVRVRTGLSFGMPFMLILLVRGAGLDWEVQDQVVDYDATDELVVRVRRPATGSAAASSRASSRARAWPWAWCCPSRGPRSRSTRRARTRARRSKKKGGLQS